MNLKPLVAAVRWALQEMGEQIRRNREAAYWRAWQNSLKG